MKTVARSVRAPRRGTRMSAVCFWAGLLGACPLAGEELGNAQTDNSTAAGLLRPGSWLTEEVFFQGEIPKELTAAPAEEPTDYRNSVELAVGGVLTHGDFAQFQQRYDLPRNAFGGIQDGHYEQDIGKRGLFSLDGHAIIDAHDYNITLSFAQPDVGYIHGGYNEFRTYSDPNGGFFPLNGQFFTPSSGVYALDRGDAWVEMGLRMPSLPQITLRYDHFFRYGQEDSTSWGLTSLTGLTGSNTSRAIVPSFRDIHERRDVFTADITQTFGITDVKVGFRYEYINNSDSLNFNQNPHTKNNSYVTQQDDLKSDLFSVHVSSETRFDDKLWFTAGYAYTGLNSQIGGSRIYGSTYDAVYNPLFPQRQQFQEGFLDLGGGSRVDQHVVNLNLFWQPYKALSILTAVRVEDENTESDSTAISTNFVPGPHGSINASNDPQSNNGTYDFLSVDESLELRYTGLANWSFYARGEWREEQNHLNSQQIDLLTNTFLLNASTDETNLLQKYIVGLNWYPLAKLNFAVQYYHSIRNYDYSNTPDNSYPYFFTNQVFNTDDLNARVTWRPLNGISLVGRYDFQRSTIDTQGGNLAKIESAVIRNHIFSADIVWTPFGSFYVQGNITYVINETDTPAVNALPGPVVTNFKNNYWDAGCSAGLALDDKTDLQVQYAYYNADDYVNNAAFSQPYGSGAVQQSVTATISRRLSKNLSLTLKYGYFTYHDITSGGHNNYDANLIYGSLQVRF